MGDSVIAIIGTNRYRAPRNIRKREYVKFPDGDIHFVTGVLGTPGKGGFMVQVKTHPESEPIRSYAPVHKVEAID